MYSARLSALLVTVVLGLVATAAPSAARPATGECVVELNTSSNYTYRCELVVSPSGGTEAKKREVFDKAMRQFSDYFPFSGCGDRLTVGQTCKLKAKKKLYNKLQAFFKVECPVKVMDIGSNYFILKSLKGHPEGEDRYIKFAVYNENNELRLAVLSLGKWSLGAQATVWTGGAKRVWLSYAANLKTI